jgi:hypothetical protein
MAACAVRRKRIPDLRGGRDLDAAAVDLGRGENVMAVGDPVRFTASPSDAPAERKVATL